MAINKKVLVLCNADQQKTILEESSVLGISFIFFNNSTEFANAYDDTIDAFVAFSSILDDTSIKIISHHVLSTPASIIINSNDISIIQKLMEANISSFFLENMFSELLNVFLAKLLLRDKKTDKLTKTIRRLNSLADNTNDGIIIVNQDGTIGYVNDSATKLTNMNKSEMVGKSVCDIFVKHPFKLKEISSDTTFHDESEFETVKGDKIFMTSTCSPNVDHGEFLGAVVILNKITSNQQDRKQELDLLKYEQRYHSQQQNLAFKKQMLILQDEMSNIKTADFIVETYFKPLDILSGDSYGSINLKDGRYLFYIIDAMGKGLSASVTALQSTSFINHSVEMSLIKSDFSLSRSLMSFQHYIRDRLMEEEALCCAFMLLDSNEETITIASYGMPPVYLQKSDGELVSIRPNNLPIMRCVTGQETTVFPLKGIEKILMTSDGLVESSMQDGNLYTEKITEDLSISLTKKHFLSLVNERIKSNDDDITFFYIRRDKKLALEGQEFIVKSSPDQITELSFKIGEAMRNDGVPEADCGVIEYALSEILMNAMEHGNFGITYQQKQKLISRGEYDDLIATLSKEGTDTYNKDIILRYNVKQPQDDKPGQLFVSIIDQGNGFVPANIFKYHTFDGNLCHVDKTSYNGRGIFISDTLLDGLYYNEQGNCACMLKIFE